MSNYGTLVLFTVNIVQKYDALAIHGGNPSIVKKFEVFNSYGEEELAAAAEVIKSGVLSKFLGSWNDNFFGGPKVLEFEQVFEEYFGVKHAISVNSWTSGLIAAIGALGLEPGDEIITSPWTMSATAIAILHWNLIPVFVDIQESNFCIDPKLVEAAISSRTRAILSVDIFGNSADIESLSSIAKRHNLILISDSAQSPGAKYDGKYAGTFGDIGGLSLNYHKHIHTGEGGVLFTNDDNLALRMQMIRNHAESASDGAGLQNTPNMIGFNFRLGEIEAAMGIEQLKKLKSIVEMKQKVANCLSHTLRNLQGLITPKIQEQNEHVYYVFPLILDKKLVHISRAEIVSALRAEGVPALSEGYQNLHMLSVFQNKSVYHNSKLPWSLNSNSQFISYEQGTFPISERLHNETFIGFGITGIDVNEEDVKLIGNAFHKVWHGLKLI